MPKLSLAIHTASADGFLKNQGITSYFKSVTNNLAAQTFKDFEFIYVDTFYEDNVTNFSSIIQNLPFVVKHVPIHPNHRYWFDLGYVYISAAKNTGILYADGKLVVSCDDAEFFPDNFLEKYWHYYSNHGLLMHAVHKRMRAIVTAGGDIVYPITGDVYVNDHRFNHVNPGHPVKQHSFGEWLFAGTSYPLEEALFLNGFNEKMDGCKSLEDCEFGSRLAMLGLKFCIDIEGYLYILDHQSYCGSVATFGSDGPDTVPEFHPVKIKKIENFIAVENFGLCRCTIELKELQANKKPLTQKHFEIIQRETLKYRQFDPLAAENKGKFDIWLKTPAFDLKKERADLRASSEWKW